MTSGSECFAMAQTDEQTDGHGNYMTESSKRVDSVKIAALGLILSSFPSPNFNRGAVSIGIKCFKNNKRFSLYQMRTVLHGIGQSTNLKFRVFLKNFHG